MPLYFGGSEGGGGGGSGVGWSGEVSTYADLPPAAENTGKVYMVLVTTGLWLINRKSAGFYHSNGSAWAYIGDYPVSAAQVSADSAGSAAAVADAADVALAAAIADVNTELDTLATATQDALAEHVALPNPHGFSWADLGVYVGTIQPVLIPFATWSITKVGFWSWLDISGEVVDGVGYANLNGVVAQTSVAVIEGIGQFVAQNGSAALAGVFANTYTDTIVGVGVTGGGTNGAADLVAVFTTTYVATVTGTGTTGGTVFTDAFTGSGDLSANWVFDSDANEKILRSADKAVNDSTVANVRFAALSSSLGIAANQYAEGFVFNAGVPPFYAGVGVRVAGATSRVTTNGYFLTKSTDDAEEAWTLRIWKVTNGVPTKIAEANSDLQDAANTYLRLQITGGSITGYESTDGATWGAAVVSVSDATYASGNPGLAINYHSAGAFVDTFEGGGL